MRHAGLLALFACFIVLPGYGQAAESTETQTLQAILAEVRSMHNDVRLGQTTQILLTELEVQQSAVTRAMQKRDEQRTRVVQLQTNEKNMATQIARFDDTSNTTMDPAQKKQMAQMIENFRSSLPALKGQEQEAGNDLQEAETTLRKEQDTLAGIQEQLNAVVKKLQPVVNP